MKRWIRWIGVLVLGGVLFPADGLAANLVIRSNGPTTELALLGQEAFHSTEACCSVVGGDYYPNKQDCNTVTCFSE